ncbi:hypothetical protein AZH53_07510 [Methanomicrobiaceae archaeon CYW5]|uniref:DUF4013 domain-containing protein n=1 Tax=Methanovulcanius yangii TaxID=1789227 RepID=UPI0029CA0097|nr:DUF4013 domain-containing protein [Methanovulcanius yangii]MBT8508249.1 hypothetical protein [Methanovulcanius yangii]
MDIGEMLGSSFTYAKEGLIGEWKRWALLLISTIIFPFLYGYLLRIYRGAVPAPDPDDWVKMFVDGILMIVIGFIYAIPVIIVAMVLMGASIFALIANPESAAGMGGMIVGILVTLILALIISLISNFALIRFAREGKFGEAFNLKAILAVISKVGWLHYFIAVLVFGIITTVIMMALQFIPFIGFILYLIALPFIAVWSARYITLIYESGAPADNW